MIFTSATLQEKEKSEETLGIKFDVNEEFFLEYPDRLFLSVISDVKKYKTCKGKYST